jgi:hypothetical protein
MVHMKEVRSSSVHSTGYDPITKTLSVRFKAGSKVYHYQDVDQDTVDAMHRAESIGKFISGHVVGKFAHQAHETA